MGRLTACLALVLALALASQASAKEIRSAKVCGKSDCRTVKDHKALVALSGGGPPADPPDHAVGWYRARLVVDTGGGHRDAFSLVVAPAAGMVRSTDEMEQAAWLPVSKDAVREYRAMTRGLEPFPAERLGGLEPRRPPKVRVDEVVLPPDDGGSSGTPIWAWIAGGAALVGALGVLILRPQAPPPFGRRS